MSFPGQQVEPFGSAWSRIAITIGDEAHLVERAAMVQIRLHIEEECQRQDERWAQPDQDFAQAMGFGYVPTVIERVQPPNYFVGARPSLLMSSADFWPSITTRAATSRASTEQIDQIDVLDVVLDVDVLCRAGPVPQERLHDQPGIDAEGEANKQVQRLSAAVHMCIRLDPSLGAAIEPIQKPPQKSQGFPMAVPGNSRERTGPYWVYCGKRLRYQATVNSY